MHGAAAWMLGALLVLAIAYRYYSAFLATKVLCLDAKRTTPAHALNDGINFHPTNRWVLFGHHFAAITGAGPLIGPVLAAQFGFLPGFTWILFGVCLGGAVHDFVILVASTRRRGRSLAEIARDELGNTLGTVTAIAILAIVIIALAGLGNVVVGALAESAWGTFTVLASVPIALGMGVHIYRVRGGSVRGIREASIVGCILLIAALWGGRVFADSSVASMLRFSPRTITFALGAYGFVASVLPVWLLLCPRDYLSSYLKLGTIAALVIGILVVNPPLLMPPISKFVGGGPVVKGPLFPFVFITIACGAISGFHALVASGTTPKMIDKETDCRAIGYGAMLLEGLVGIVALIAACVVPPEDYLAINTNPDVAVVASDATHQEGLARSREELEKAGAVLTDHDRAVLGLKDAPIASLAGHAIPASKALALSNRTLAALGYHVDAAAARPTMLDDGDFARMGLHVKELPALSRQAGEVVAARTGGGVSLAVGMARVFSGVPGMSALLSYWYHFAIMFEALFILTAIDTGTRIARFLLQEMFSRSPVTAWLGESDSKAGAVLATSAVVFGFTAFILTNGIQTLWPMFGVANQLLACAALSVATTILLRESRFKIYALCTFLPLCFVATTTISAGVQSIRLLFLPMLADADPGRYRVGLLNTAFTAMMLVCIAMVIAGSVAKWIGLLQRRRAAPGATA